MLIKVKRLSNKAKIPQYQTSGAACFDLHLCDDRVVINPQERISASTGLAFEIPKGHVMLVFARSGQAFNHGLALTNGVGVIDSDYRGEVFVSLHNTKAEGILAYNPGDRIAQAMIIPYPAVQLEETQEELSETDRGQGGAGSTGM